MNEDYLYNKIGEDAEIENLENLLKDFRQQNTKAPEIPAENVILFRKPRRKFRYAFAIAAGLLISFTFGVLFYGSKQNNQVSENENKENEVKTMSFADENAISNQQTASSKQKNIISDDKIAISEWKTAISNQQTTISKRKTAISTDTIAISNDKTTVSVVKIGFSNNKIAFPKENLKKLVRKSEKTTNNLTDEEKFAYEQLKLALSITGSNLKTVKEKIDNKEVKTSALNYKVITK